MSATLAEHLRAAAASLNRAGLCQSVFEARALLAGVLDLSREEMVARPDRPVSPAEAVRLGDALDRRARGEPLARITGYREFWSLPIRLAPETLVPRPETETVVEEVLDRLADRDAAYSILDLGTGSGCLLLALLTELRQAQGIGVDRAEGALRVARENARNVGVTNRARFVCGDWGASLRGPFDIIVTNPPYISGREMAALPREVKDFDPHLALAGGEDGLAAYRALAPDFARLLAPGGFGVLELGAGQAEAVSEIFRDSGHSVGQARSDLGGHARALPVAAGGKRPAAAQMKKKVGNRAVPV